MGVLEQVRARFDMLTRTGPGAGRRPGDPKISDFIGDQQGVDSLTTSTITMLHKMDSVTLVNSFDGIAANFQIKFVTKVAQQTLWWTTSEKTTEKVENFTLNAGESKTITLDEGTLIHYGVGKITKNVDIFIELISVDGWDKTGQEETTYVSPGGMVFGEGGYWNPQNVIKRVRGRRMVIGPAHYPGRWLVMLRIVRRSSTSSRKGLSQTLYRAP